MSANRYAAQCKRCKETVPAEEGNITKGDGGWDVTHAIECQDVEGESTGSFTANDGYWTEGDSFRHREHGMITILASEHFKDLDYETDEWYEALRFYFRAATTEEIEAHERRIAEQDARVAKIESAKELVEGRIACNCSTDPEGCNAPHLDKDRESERLSIRRGDAYNEAI